jgi:hypothetical protein
MDPLAFAAEATGLFPPRDLLAWEQSEIPDGPGVYVFVAKRAFVYPHGRSPVFYIGQAVNLRRRLYHHKMAILRAKGERLLAVYRPVTEYAAEFGASVAISKPQRKPRDVEFELLAKFMKTFLGLPVANSAVNWRKVREYLKVEAEK